MSRLTLALLLALPLAALAQTKPKADDGAADSDGRRVALAFDPGSHTRPISTLGFNKDQSKLITVGWDYSIQVWSTKTGERLDILRLPPFGLDNGTDANSWQFAAVSADGAVVAVGGGGKRLTAGAGTSTRLVVVDVTNRRVRSLSVPAPPEAEVVSLALSATGDRLAVGFGLPDRSVYVVDDVLQRLKNAADEKPPSAPAPVMQKLAHNPHTLALSSSGNKLAVEVGMGNRSEAVVSVWDVTGKAAEKWKKAGEFTETVERHGLLEWSPDETQFAWTWRKGEGKEKIGIQLRGADGGLIKNWTFGELAPGFGRAAIVGTLRYLAADQLFLAARVSTGGMGSGQVANAGVTLDPKTGKSARRFSEESTSPARTIGSASANGKLAANTTSNSLDVVVYNLADGKMVARCGSPTLPPTTVAWAKAGKGEVIAWADAAKQIPPTADVDDLEFAFDLAAVQPVARITKTDFGRSLRSFKDWKLAWGKGTGGIHTDSATLSQRETVAFKWEQSEALALIPTGGEYPLLARGAHEARHSLGSNAIISDTTGKVVAVLRPSFTRIGDMVASPDGRYLLVSTGNQRLSVYRGDGSSRFPLLNLVQSRGEWVVWTPEGYYSASPGGEKLIGWAVSNGPNELATFHPADKLAKHFRRPDLIKLALEKGSVVEALTVLKTATPDVETILPPVATLTLLKQEGGAVTVRAEARGVSKGKPVLAMRVLLDGKPLADGQGVWDPSGRQPASGEFAFAVPAGLHELKVLARTEDGASVSQVVQVRGPKGNSPQPTLHRLCIGIDEYDDPGLKLGSAVKDAEGVYAALERYCVGPDNRFGAVSGELLVNKNATRQKAVQALAGVRNKVKPGDLVVVFFAGHGIKQKDEFYLVTREGDPAKSLGGASLSGADLKKELAQMECPVLLILDACHSAAAVKTFRPATDDLTRTMTDDSVGVTVLSAAMSHETAGATAENGHFTAGLLKGLAAGTGVPFDPYEKQMYIHHLYAVAYSEVRRATGGKQNPFLNMPWTMSPLIVREVPVK